MNALIRPTIVLFAAFTVLTGAAYPALVTGIAQSLFPHQANGSLIARGGEPVGSALIGQQFDASQYFWGRLSATSPNPYNATASSGSNLGPTNPALFDEIKGRAAALHQADPGNTAAIPVDLVTSSGSGLDPEISPAAAYYQVNRVAKARGLSPDVVRQQVNQYTSGRDLGFLGEPRVNVLRLNLALDAMRRINNGEPRFSIGQ